MKHDWEYKKLGEVCDVSAGQGAPQGEQSYCEKGTPFIKAGNLEDLVNGLDEGSVQNVSRSIAQKHKLKLYKAGSVLFAKSGMSCMKGYVHVLQRDCYVVSHLAILTPQTIDGHFLKYYLRFTKTYSLVKDEAYPSISLSDIASFPVPVPPLPTQRAIVAELDTLNEILDKKRQQLKELDTLAQSIFYDMFGDPVENEKGWEVTTLSKITLEKLSYGSGASAVDYNGIVRYVRITDIDVYGNLNDEVKSPSEFDEKYLLHEGDILFARSGATVGKTYCHSEKNGKAIYAGYLIRLIPDPSRVLPKYVFYYTKSEYYKSFVELVQNAVAQPNINAKQYGSLMIPLPPLPLQQSFAKKIEAIEKQKELIKASIAEVETLLAERMEYWFGE